MNKSTHYLKTTAIVFYKLTFILILCVVILSIIVKYTSPKYYGPKYEAALFQKLDDFSVKYGKAHNMELIDIGDFTEPRKGLLYGIWLRSFNSETVEQGRNQAVTLVNDLWNLIQHDPVSITYFNKKKRSSSKFRNENLSLKTVGINLAYWDKNTNRPQRPYLAQISFFDEMFYYYQTDQNTQALRLIHTESYEDARRIVEARQNI